MARRKKVEEPEVLEISGIPTAAGLAKMGREFAEVRYDRRGVKNYHITQKGHDLIGRKLRDQARQDERNGIWHGITGKQPARP